MKLDFIWMSSLSRRDIDVNVLSKKGLTPVMEATKKGKIESLKVTMIYLFKMLIELMNNFYTDPSGR